MLTITCPHCQSTNIRSSLSRTIWESAGKAFGFFQLRCKDCDTRFSGHLWDFRHVLYAKCPRCYALDLTTWTTRYYRVSSWWLFLIKVGARQHRCEYCRHNFISFRPAKTKFLRRKMYPE